MVQTSRAVPRTDSPGRIVAHRGASRIAPENTLAAFRAAAAQGADWIEFDVSLLGDGTPVVHHDPDFDRCTNARGPLSRATARDLDGIEAGVRFGRDFAGEPLPTLEATLDLIEELGLSANLEIKPHRVEPDAVAAAVADALGRRSWADRRVLVSSFAPEALERLRARRPDQPIAVLWDRLPADWEAIVTALGAAAVHLDWRRLRVDRLAEARARGVEVRVYTINSPARVVGLRERGLTGVISDHPPLFLDDPKWSAWADTDDR